MLKVSDLKKIKIQQNKSIRLIFKVGRRVRLSELYKKAHLLMVEDMIELELLKISYRYVNSILPVGISNLFDIGNHDYLQETEMF